MVWPTLGSRKAKEQNRIILCRPARYPIFDIAHVGISDLNRKDKGVDCLVRLSFAEKNWRASREIDWIDVRDPFLRQQRTYVMITRI